MSQEKLTSKQKTSKKTQMTVIINDVPAGFPSVASDVVQHSLDLNQLVIEHPAATFFVRVLGYSMKKEGISSGDVLVVDRSRDPKNNDIVIAVIDSELTVKKLSIKGKKTYLVPENDEYHPMEITEGMSFEVWGVVTHIIHRTIQ